MVGSGCERGGGWSKGGRRGGHTPDLLLKAEPGVGEVR